MQTLHLTGINKLLHPERDKRSATERIFDHLSHSNIGLNRGEATADTGSAASALDSFSVTQNISELLSPACGMSEEEKKAYLAKIIAKLKSGKKLTSEEMRFLQAEDHSYTIRRLVSRQCVAPLSRVLRTALPRRRRNLSIWTRSRISARMIP